MTEHIASHSARFGENITALAVGFENTVGLDKGLYKPFAASPFAES